MLRRIPTDAEWVSSRIGSLPPRWANRLRKAWEARQGHDYYGANVELRETTEDLYRVRIPLDASDATMCDAAKTLALQWARLAELFHVPSDLRAAMDSPDEPGASTHRCDFKLIDRNKGSAAGYIAKYVAKNIDGQHVGKALSEGHLRLESAGKAEKIVYVAVSRSERWSDPEEKVRAEFYAELIYKYGYSPERIGVEVTVPDRSPNDFADLVVFHDDDRKKPLCMAQGMLMCEALAATNGMRPNHLSVQHWRPMRSLCYVLNS